MSFRLLSNARTLQQSVRAFNSSPVNQLKQWRMSKGLPENRCSEGILTDGPDYTFVDGRPTPLLNNQKKRLLKQRNFAEQIVTLSQELDFAIDREAKLDQAKKEERQKILNNRLKPKGYMLNKKK